MRCRRVWWLVWLVVLLIVVLSFFFQAEDGIRDYKVTGVQTCALPIWKAPANFKIESFVIRVGDWGGYMLMECDDPLEVHKFCSMLPAFTFEARPVVPVADAIRVELEAMAYRDGLKGK